MRHNINEAPVRWQNALDLLLLLRQMDTRLPSALCFWPVYDRCVRKKILDVLDFVRFLLLLSMPLYTWSPVLSRNLVVFCRIQVLMWLCFHFFCLCSRNQETFSLPASPWGTATCSLLIQVRRPSIRPMGWMYWRVVHQTSRHCHKQVLIGTDIMGMCCCFERLFNSGDLMQFYLDIVARV